MIPIRLTLKGIFSYQTEQTIDFNPLISSQVFGVFGGVGSGKSTILDAITFALYGELDRLGSRDSRGYNMMNLKSDELLIDFEFRTGANDDIYRFVVTAKRNSKNFEDVKSFVRKSYQKHKEEWIPLEDNDAESIIGISYKNFKRTVIIPQGKFQEFLQLGSTARSEMLKEIFNLNKYDLRDKVGSLAKRNDNNIHHYEGEIKQFLLLDNVMLEALKDSLTKLEQSNKEANERRVVLIKEMDELKKTKHFFEEQKRVLEKLASLEEQKNVFQVMEEEIVLLNYCLIHFKPLLDKEQSLLLKRKKTSTNIQSIKENLDQKQKVLKDKLKSLAEHKLLVDQKIKIHNEISEFQKIIKIIRLKDGLVKQNIRLEKGNELIKTLELKTKDLELKEKEYKKELQSYKKDKPDFLVLSKIEQWFDRKDQIGKRLKDVDFQIKQGKQQLSDIKNGFSSQKVVVDFHGKIDFKNNSKEDIELKFEEEKLIFKTEIVKIEAEILKWETNKKLEELSDVLHDGESCPLCGSEDHPHRLESGDAEKQLDHLSKGKKQWVSVQDRWLDLIRLYEKYEFQSSEIKKKNEKYFNEFEHINNERKQHLSEFNWKQYSQDRIVFDQVYLKAKELESKIENKEIGIEKIRDELKEEQKKKDTYKTAVRKIEKEYTSDRSNQKTLLEQIVVLDFELYKNNKTDILTDLSLEKKQKFDSSERLFIQLDKETDVLNTEIGHLNGRLLEEEKEYGELEVEFQQVLVNIKLKSEESGIFDLQKVRTVLENMISLESKKKELEQYKTSLKSYKEQLVQLLQKMDGKVFDEEIFVEKDSILSQNNQLIKEQQEKIGSLKNEIAALVKDLAEKKKLKKTLKDLNLRKENINVLKNMFKGNGFVDYISSVYLEQLCGAANARFYNLTKHQLKLELTEKNDFKVIDYLNEGKERSVKTLSGGQTFQAALSLALALAESVQQQSQSKQNFFFLDEGFGTQDEQSLLVVFDTLKSLRKEKRIIGIISHLEALKNEIEVSIQVENREEIGSIITTSY